MAEENNQNDHIKEAIDTGTKMFNQFYTLKAKAVLRAIAFTTIVVYAIGVVYEWWSL